jgi:Family of unknown function (DUF5675)
MILTMQTFSSDEATTGTMFAGVQAFFTLELPWRDNLVGQSCVPGGEYLLIPYNSPKHGPTWCLDNPAQNIYGSWEAPTGGRTSCEIHSANWAEQLEGCIALGFENLPMLDPITGRVEPAVENSRDAVAELLKLLSPMSSGNILQIKRL